MCVLLSPFDLQSGERDGFTDKIKTLFRKPVESVGWIFGGGFGGCRFIVSVMSCFFVGSFWQCLFCCSLEV